MNTVSLKLPGPLAAQLAETARRRSMSKSALIRDALEAYLRKAAAGQEGTALSLAADLRGMLSGPEDLSANEQYLRDFGR